RGGGRRRGGGAGAGRRGSAGAHAGRGGRGRPPARPRPTST
ncbi:sugar ABC transporter permease, partial [Burkholderia pseudomallei]